MAKRDAESGNTKQSEPSSAAYGYFRVHEQHKTLRTVVICTTIIICLGLAAWATIRIVEIVQWPWWLTLAWIIVAGAPSGGYYVLFRVYRRYIRHRNRRVVELEKVVDKKRESSGLEDDGSSQFGI
jgi:TRAP-type C4-dicarboxylate transport system permease small subunit